MSFTWVFDLKSIDWNQLWELYRIAPLGNRSAEELKIAFTNSKYKCFVYDEESLIGVGRGLADGADCFYLCDVAIHPDYQGTGLGKQVTLKLMEFAKGHKKIILFANEGKGGFYAKLGFKNMTTAMAVFQNEEEMFQRGLLSEP